MIFLLCNILGREKRRKEGREGEGKQDLRIHVYESIYTV